MPKSRELMTHHHPSVQHITPNDAAHQTCLQYSIDTNLTTFLLVGCQLTSLAYGHQKAQHANC